ncbi:MAG: hypothetical protein ACI4CS_11035 [Candidatus Weimeria sp.]
MSRFELEHLARENGLDPDEAEKESEEDLYLYLAYHNESAGKDISGNGDSLYELFGLV